MRNRLDLPAPFGAEHADLGAGVERQRDVLEHRAVGRVDAGELVTGVDEFVGHGVANLRRCIAWRDLPWCYVHA